MELEDLKTIWQDRPDTSRRHPGGWQQTGQQQSDRQQTSRQIRALLRKRSHGLVAKMKRNLFGELLLVLMIYTPAILFYLFEFREKDPATGWALLLLLICFTVYYYRKNKLLNAMQRPDAAIRANLEQQLITLRGYIRFYTLAGTILVPVMGILALLPWLLTGPERWKGIGICVAVLVPVTFLSYRVNVWGINRLYGRHIKKLKGLLEEMDEEHPALN